MYNYSGFFCDILSLIVKMYLWLKLYTVPFFVSGQTYKISKRSHFFSSTVHVYTQHHWQKCSPTKAASTHCST